MLSDPDRSRSELFSELLTGLSHTSSAVETFSWIGKVLKQHLGLDWVWIGHPAALDTESLRCYWVLEVRSAPEIQSETGQERATSRLRVIQPSILDQLKIAADGLIWIEPESDRIWQDTFDLGLVDASLSPVEQLVMGSQAVQAVQRFTSAQPAVTLYSSPTDLDRPQLLGACYPQGELPWLLGLIGDREGLMDPKQRRQIPQILQLATLALERQVFLQRAQLSEQKQRSTTNRWMDRFRVATEATRQVVYEWDIDSEQMEWSSTIRSIFGHGQTEETETRRWWTAQIHPEDRQRVIRQISQCLEDLQVFLCEYRWRRADGYYAWVRDYGRILCGPQGYAVRLIGSLEDISAQRRTTKLLQQLRRELQTTMALTPVPILILNPELQITQTNPALVDLLGLEAESSSDLGVARLVHPVDLDSDLIQQRQLLAGEIESYTTEKRLIHTAGHEIPTQITVSLLGDGLMDREMIWRIKTY